MSTRNEQFEVPLDVCPYCGDTIEHPEDYDPFTRLHCLKFDCTDKRRYDERMADVPLRRAKVMGGLNVNLATVCAYLPSNYVAMRLGDDIIIEGKDDHGWTLDGYVIPRLGSGLIRAEEIS